ncbi:DUF255 domain-containing protein [Bacillus atrophaeus]|nr:DUF255 domain-containing protein [Bacillus atrophaeus]MED4808316.1 DUF255 domain-containing protein [Bacillus atrophaeus]
MPNNSKPNRLIVEKSPYSFQYALDWHHWREEEFKKAKRKNKPVQVNIGYSTCHWWHKTSCYNQLHNNFTPLQKTLRTVCQ